jgi:hypothetical protein
VPPIIEHLDERRTRLLKNSGEVIYGENKAIGMGELACQSGNGVLDGIPGRNELSVGPRDLLGGADRTLCPCQDWTLLLGPETAEARAKPERFRDLKDPPESPSNRLRRERVRVYCGR